MTSHWIGIDPGFEGAVSILDAQGELVTLWDMPLLDRKAKGRTRQVDVKALAALMVSCRRLEAPEVYLEWPTTRPDEAAEASKRFGVGLGYIEALVAANAMDLTRVAPNKWKQDLGLPGKKHADYTVTESKRMACSEVLRLVPNVERAHVFGPKGGAKDGRAEAILIAWWSWSRTVHGMRVLAERWGKGSIEAQAFVLSAGRRGRKVRKGPLF